MIINMRKSLLTAALLLSWAGTSYAQSSVTLYGIVDTALIYANNQTTGGAGAPGHSGIEMDSGGISGTRWGLRGSEDLGGGLSAVFLLEDGFSSANGKLSNSGDLFGRQAYVGLSSNTYGTITAGRQYSFMSQYLSALSAEGLGWAGNLADHPFDNDDMIRHQSIQNSVRYESPTYRGLTVGTMYGFSNEAGEFSNDRAYSMGAKYDNGPVSLVARSIVRPALLTSTRAALSPTTIATPSSPAEVSRSGGSVENTTSVRHPLDWCGPIRRPTT
jgi:GBP family porin